MIVLTDMQVHVKPGDLPDVKPCQRGTWSVRMVVETVVSLLPTTCRVKQLNHRTWPQGLARISFLMALFNVLVVWDGLPVDADGHIHLSIAPCRLSWHEHHWLAKAIRLFLGVNLGVKGEKSCAASTALFCLPHWNAVFPWWAGWDSNSGPSA